ncbi:MAG: hypothetical protein KFH87_12355 [Bacteroidetes bacterium]|nr:hypothetical protein [Bacteroidota bacterium]
MLELKGGAAVDAIAPHPVYGGTIAAGREEPMHHGDEDGAFDRKFEATIRKHTIENSGDTAFLPQALIQQRGADTFGFRCGCFPACVSIEDVEVTGEFETGGEKGIKGATFLEFVEVTETVSQILYYLVADAFILDDMKVGVGSSFLGTDEHGVTTNIRLYVTDVMRFL